MQVLTAEQLEGLDQEQLIEQLERLGDAQGEKIDIPEGLENTDLVKLYLDSIKTPAPPKEQKPADNKQIKMLKNARFAEGDRKVKKYQVAKDEVLSVGRGGIQKQTAEALVKDALAEWIK